MLRLSCHSLRIRVLLLVLLAALPGVGLVLYADSKERRYLAAQAEENALRLVRIVAADQERLIEGAHHLLIALAQLPQVRGGDPRECSALFADLLRQYPFYTGFLATTSNGDAFCSAPPSLGQLVTFADRLWYQRIVQAREFVVGEYQIGRLSGKAVIVLGYPVLDATARLQGVVATALDLAWLNRLATEAELPPGSALTVMDRNGTILARHPDPEKWVGKSFSNAPIFRDVLSQREGTARAVGMDGTRRLYAFAPLGGGRDTGAYVSIGIPIAIAFAGADQALRRNLVGLGLVAALALGAAWSAGGLFILRPVNALVHATERLAANDLAARTGLPYGRGEVSQLARAFDEMAAALERHLAGRQQAEEALRESEKRYRELAESLPQVIFEMDGRGCLTFTNNQGLEAFGYAPEDLEKGIDVLDTIVSEDRERAKVNMQRVLRGENLSGGEYTALGKDGRMFPIVIYSTPIIRHGNPVGVRGILVDITDRKRAEEALGCYVARLKTLQGIDRAILAAQSPEAIAEAALSHLRHLVPSQRASIALFDSPTQTVSVLAVDVNGETRVGTGTRLPMDAFGPLEDLRQNTVHLVEDVSLLSSPPQILRLLQAEGVRSVINAPLIVQGELIGALNLGAGTPGALTLEHGEIAREIADQLAVGVHQARLHEQVQRHALELEERVRERTQELAAANTQLEETSRHKSEFLANMSHELRTPLSSILGFSELLREQTIGPLNEKQARYIGHIHQSGSHLLHLIRDILDLAKVEAGKIVLQPETLPVASTLEDILVIARGLANKKAQNVMAEIEPNLPPLHADPIRLKQICFNLLSNAVKFTPERGRITLAARRVDSSTGQPVDSGSPIDQLTARPIDNAGEWLEIAVTDTGIGIRAEDLPRLFQEFVQLPTTRTQRHEGTGLGLALTKQLVELHGGRIRAESEGEGRGSTFTVVMPFNGFAGWSGPVQGTA